MSSSTRTQAARAGTAIEAAQNDKAGIAKSRSNSKKSWRTVEAAARGDDNGQRARVGELKVHREARLRSTHGTNAWGMRREETKYASRHVATCTRQASSSATHTQPGATHDSGNTTPNDKEATTNDKGRKRRRDKMTNEQGSAATGSGSSGLAGTQVSVQPSDFSSDCADHCPSTWNRNRRRQPRHQPVISQRSSGRKGIKIKASRTAKASNRSQMQAQTRTARTEGALKKQGNSDEDAH